MCARAGGGRAHVREGVCVCVCVCVCVKPPEADVFHIFLLRLRTLPATGCLMCSGSVGDQHLNHELNQRVLRNSVKLCQSPQPPLC